MAQEEKEPQDRIQAAEQVLSALSNAIDHTLSARILAAEGLPEKIPQVISEAFKSLRSAIELTNMFLEVSRRSERPQPEPEFCICAALRMPSGKVIYGHRHNNCLDVARVMFDRADVTKAEQGFVTSKGRFVNRKEGMKVQLAAGRRSHNYRDGRYTSELLYSEDLY